ncbi:MAG: hypothetical protein NT149_00140 [Candidatus Gottesmanbacteria bacterium]|nr:hypothetical protein [Candidatus Gottesmanbacteria bacterium]
MEEITQPTPQTPPQPKKQSGVFIGILLFLIGILVGLVIYKTMPYFGASPTPLVSPTPSAEAGDPTAQWERHIFPKMGFSLALPPKWYPHEEKSDIGGSGYESWISYPVDNPSPQAPMVEGLVANFALSTFVISNSLDQDANIRLTQPGHIEPIPEKLNSTLDGEKSIILKSPKVIQVIADHNGKRFLFQLGTDDPSLAQVFDQILSTFKFTDTTSSQQVLGIQVTQCCSCPTMIDASQIGKNGWVAYEQGKDYTAQLPKACSLPNIGACAPCLPLETKSYTCPPTGWVDCMPGPDAKPECSAEAMTWYKANCPNFKGGAL